MAKLREVDVQFPLAGENRRGAYSGREAPFTSPYAENIRSFDSLERRGRGGSRPPLKKWITDYFGPNGYWDIYLSKYSSNSIYVGTVSASSVALSFNSTGTAMYVLDITTNSVFQYTLSTAWNVSTAVYATKTFSFTTEDTSVWGIFFKSDGATMYASGRTNDKVYQYTLSTPWDVSTAVYATKFASVAAEDLTPGSIYIKSDGATMFLLGRNNDTIYQYTLGTPWDISTAAYATKSLDVSTEDTDPFSIFFKADGTELYVLGAENDLIYQYTLSTAWDISTATYDSRSISSITEGPGIRGMFIKSDGSKMYLVGITNDYVYEYDVIAGITAMERLSYQDGSGVHQEDLIVISAENLSIIQGSSVTTVTAYLEDETGTVITTEDGEPIEFNSTVASVNTVNGTGGYNMVQYSGRMYIAGDYCYEYRPNDGTVFAVENAPSGQPLVEVYRHRLLLGGADHIFGMSEEGDFTKWTFYDIERGAVRAVAGTPTDDGKLGGDITCFKSWGIDAVIIATKDSIWVVRGNPNTNGQLSSVSRDLGIVSQGAISITGNGQVVFLARSGLYSWHIGSNSAPEKFSENIVPEELKDVDTDSYVVSMKYNEKEGGIHLFITPVATTVGTHWFLDLETRAFWREKYAAGHQPLAVATMPISGDSNVILGCRDGYLRVHDYSVTDDDGEYLNSDLLLGPFRLGGQGGHMGMIQKIFSALADNSNSVTWAIVTGNTAEEAVDKAVTDIQAGTTANVVATGTWSENWNPYAYARSRGAYAVIWLSSSSVWAHESMGFVKKILGRHRSI